MVNYTWKTGPVPLHLKVRQVYGIVFTKDGRILLRVEDNRMKLTGGKPEYNESYEETLKREYIEELNVEIEEIYYLGYLLVEENNEQYAQVRMIGKIKEVHESCPDIDTGKKYRRFLANWHHVKKYLDYQDEAGNLMLEEAITLAIQKYNMKRTSNIEEMI